MSVKESLTVNLFISIWKWIDEPRIHRILTSVKYVLSSVLGIILLIPSTMIVDPITGGIAVAGGIALLIGALLGAFFSLTKRWIWERPAIMLSGLGTMLFMFVEVSLAGEGHVFQSTIIITILLMYIVALVDRYIEIFRDDYEVTDLEIKQAADEAILKIADNQ